MRAAIEEPRTRHDSGSDNVRRSGCVRSLLVLGAVLRRFPLSRRSRRNAAVELGALLRDREDRRGTRLPQHPLPVLLSGRAGHAVLRRRLRADHVEDQSAGGGAVRRDAADHAGAHRGDARPYAEGPADAQHHLVRLSGRDRRQPLPLPALARGGANPAPGLDARRDRPSGRGLSVQESDRPIPPGRTSRTAGRCSISAAIRPMRSNCAARSATST